MVGIVEPIVTETSRYHVRDDGIIVQAVVSRGRQTLEHARANIAVFNQLAAGRPRMLLVDMQVAYSVEPRAREFYATHEASRYVQALAMVTPSTATRVIGNFFLALNKPIYPCRMFSSVDEAASWLHSFAGGVRVERSG